MFFLGQTPEGAFHALRADSLSIRCNQVSTTLFPAKPVSVEILVSVDVALVVSQRTGIGLGAVSRPARRFGNRADACLASDLSSESGGKWRDQ